MARQTVESCNYLKDLLMLKHIQKPDALTMSGLINYNYHRLYFVDFGSGSGLLLEPISNMIGIYREITENEHWFINLAKLNYNRNLK